MVIKRKAKRGDEDRKGQIYTKEEKIVKKMKWKID